MRGYMSLAGKDDAKEIPVEDRVGLYRIQERNQQVFAEVKGNVIPLGVSDPTVSRKKGSPPVEIVPRDEFIEVRNNGNHNPVKVDENATDTLDKEVSEGAVATLQRDATVEIGYQTELKLVVERSARKEVNVQGEKVVMGDEVDNSTNVTDSVVNRSDIGDDGGSGTPAAGGGGATVDDSVVNRSNVAGGGGGGGTGAGTGAGTGGGGGGGTGGAGGGTGAGAGGGAGGVGTDTQRYCDVHDRTYAGEQCPQCAAGRDGSRDRRREGGASDAAQDAGGGGSGEPAATNGSTAGGTSDTKYCIYCGEEIPAPAVHCPSCGEQLPD